MSEPRPQAGFTLVELMISLVLFSLAVAGVLSVAVSITQGYAEQRQSMNAESAVRSPIDYIADALRQVSPAVADPSKVEDAGSCVLGAISVSNGTGWGGSDELNIVYAAGAVATSARTGYNTGDTSLDVNDASQLVIDDHILITDLSSGHLVKITNKSSNTLTLASQCSITLMPSGGYPPGSIVVRAQQGRFFIDLLDGVPTLWMDPDGDRVGTPNDREPVAEGIEDMQISYAIDTNADGTLGENGAAASDDEWWYTHSGETPPAGTIRAVRVTLVARATKPLPGTTTPFARPAAEDHAAAVSNDAYRRRVLRTMVELRNIGGSP